MSDEIPQDNSFQFPEEMRFSTFELHGFVYVISTKPIMQGDLLFCIYPNGAFIMGLCLDDSDPYTITIRSGDIVDTSVLRARCRRLTFSIPLNRYEVLN